MNFSSPGLSLLGIVIMNDRHDVGGLLVLD